MSLSSNMSFCTPVTGLARAFGPIGSCLNFTLSGFPRQTTTKKTFVEQGTCSVAPSNTRLATSNLQTCTGIAIVMDNGARLLAHFDNSGSVEKSLEIGIKILERNYPDAKIKKIVVSGGIEADPTLIDIGTQTIKYAIMASACHAYGILGALSTYLCCQVSGPFGASVIDAHTREEVIRCAKLICNDNPSLLEIKRANIDMKEYSDLLITKSGEIQANIYEDYSNRSDRDYRDTRNTECQRTNEPPSTTSLQHITHIGRPIIQEMVSTD